MKTNYFQNTPVFNDTPDKRLMKFAVIPPPENLHDVVECSRISEYTGEAGLSFNIT
jgi:hypothetical protein